MRCYFRNDVLCQPQADYQSAGRVAQIMVGFGVVRIDGESQPVNALSTRPSCPWDFRAQPRLLWAFAWLGLRLRARS
jgi:hypothetical protein